MKVLRTTEDVLSLKNGDEVLVVSRRARLLVACTFLSPSLTEEYDVGLYLKQNRGYHLIAIDMPTLIAHLNNTHYNFNLHKDEVQ